MSEETKEMFHCIEMNCKHNKCFGGIKLDKEDCKLLLDYITNLHNLTNELTDQKKILLLKNKDYKSRRKRAIEYINFVINHYKEQLKTPIEDTYFDSDVNRKGYILSIIAYLQTILDILNGIDENV